MKNNLINTNLGQYRVMAVIGRGSTSTIYKGYQPSLNRPVAIKVLLRNLDPQFASRFRREAQAIAQLQHPNILPIYDYGEQDGLHYFVMQYIENGTTLSDIISGQPLEPLPALRLMDSLLDALDYAHRRGVIHRDIKPSNVLMPRPDWPMLADFGIAKLIDDSQSLTPVGQTVGTAAYMAPERAANRPVDARTDIYSAGIVLYEMMTGEVPFDDTTPVAVLMKHVNEPLPPPRSLNPEVPEVVEQVLLRALNKDPDARYQTAAEMRQDVQRAIVQVERARALNELMLGAAVPQPDTRYKTGKLPLEAPATATTAPVRTSPAVARRPPGSLPAAGPAPGVQQQRTNPSGPIVAIALVLMGIGLVGILALSGLFNPAARAGQPTPGGAAAPETVTTTVPAVGGVPRGSATPAPEVGALPPTEPPPPEVGASVPTEPPPPEQPTPTTAAPVQPAPSPPPTIDAAPVLPTQSGDMTIFLLEDSAWQGGYRRPGGRTYGGRTATWIYGAGTDYATMRAAFDVPTQPAGTAQLSVEGMDSEGSARTLISIQVNGVEIYRDRNPLPDDDQPLETGTWATATWTFDAALLRPGRNDISISNLDPGVFSRPPFFMLDYATVSYSRQSSVVSTVGTDD